MGDSQIALVITDFEMPELDGLELTRAIRAEANTRDEINEMFDGITYEKGGSILHMVESYLGEETFRQGVHNYLKAHMYANATAEDFWNAQTAASHKPVDTIMASFIAEPGVPLLTFSLTAGHIFEKQLGMVGVVAAGLAATTINLILTYWLARRAFRPAFTRLVKRLGYAVPQLDAADQTDLVIILRVTTGIPFFVQNYIAGLADVPFARYLVISCAAVWTYTTGFILFGDALFQGKGHLALVAISILIAAIAVTHMYRRHYAKKKRAA